jgi:hypothetical protein
MIANSHRFRWSLAILVTVVVAGLLAPGGRLDRSRTAHKTKTAVIIDQLELTQPNPAFVASATRTLTDAGYTVDYYSGRQVTVDLYRNLPTFNYDVVILRAHTGRVLVTDKRTGEVTQSDYLTLFSGEEYSATKYQREQGLGWLAESRYAEGGSQDDLFGIVPSFIDRSMAGKFNNTLVIMMGCDGLRSAVSGEAFLAKGASALVSWSKPVSANQTDTATQILLDKVFTHGQAVASAVEDTAREVGPDPTYGGELRVLTSTSAPSTTTE